MNNAPQQRFRFGLKSLLVVTTLAGILLASMTYPLIEARQQQALMNRVSAIGGRVFGRASVPRPFSAGRYLLSCFRPGFGSYTGYGFDFSGTAITDDDLEWVAQIKHVKELNLSGTRVTDAGLQHLRDLKFVTKLELANTRVTDNAEPDLETLNLLSSLNVNGTAVSDAALAKLDSKLQYAHFSEERAIDELKAAGIRAMDPLRVIEGDLARGCPIIYAGRQVSHLYVGGGRTLTKRDVENLSRLESLENLKFHTVRVGTDGLAALQPLPNLKTVEMHYVDLTDRDLKALAGQSQLESLTLTECNQLTDEGFAQLKALNNLKQLHVHCKGVSQDAINELGKQLPNCRIDRG